MSSVKKDVFYPTLVPGIKNNHLSYSIYKHDSINIADLSSMRDACHMNFEFEIDLAHRRVCGSVVEHRSAESEGLRFDSSWVLRIFSLSHARGKTKTISLSFLTKLKTYHLSYSIVNISFTSKQGSFIDPKLS